MSRSGAVNPSQVARYGDVERDAWAQNQTIDEKQFYAFGTQDFQIPPEGDSEAQQSTAARLNRQKREERAEAYRKTCRLTDQFFCQVDPQNDWVMQFHKQDADPSLVVPCCQPTSQAAFQEMRTIQMEKLMRINERIQDFYKLMKDAAADIQAGTLLFTDTDSKDEEGKAVVGQSSDFDLFLQLQEKLRGVVVELQDRTSACVDSIFTPDFGAVQKIPLEICEPVEDIVKLLEEGFYKPMFAIERLIAKARVNADTRNMRKKLEASRSKLGDFFRKTAALFWRVVDAAKTAAKAIYTVLSYMWTYGLKALRAIFRVMRGAASLVLGKICGVEQESTRLAWYVYLYDYIDFKMKDANVYVQVRNALEQLRGASNRAWVKFMSMSTRQTMQTLQIAVAFPKDNDTATEGKSSHMDANDLVDFSKAKAEDALPIRREVTDAEKEGTVGAEEISSSRMLELAKRINTILETAKDDTMRVLNQSQCARWLWSVVVQCMDVIFRLTRGGCRVGRSIGNFLSKYTEPILTGIKSQINRPAVTEVAGQTSRAIAKVLEYFNFSADTSAPSKGIPEEKASRTLDSVTKPEADVASVIKVDVSLENDLKKGIEHVKKGGKVEWDFSQADSDDLKGIQQRIADAELVAQEREKTRLDEALEDKEVLALPSVDLTQKKDEVNEGDAVNIANGLKLSEGTDALINIAVKAFFFFSRHNALPQKDVGQDLERYIVSDTEALAERRIPQLNHVPDYVKYTFCRAQNYDDAQCLQLIEDQKNKKVPIYGHADLQQRYDMHVQEAQRRLAQLKSEQEAAQVAALKSEPEIRRLIMDSIDQVRTRYPNAEVQGIPINSSPEEIARLRAQRAKLVPFAQSTGPTTTTTTKLPAPRAPVIEESEDFEIIPPRPSRVRLLLGVQRPPTQIIDEDF